MTELLSCPFCFQNQPDITTSTPCGVQVRCGWCGATGPCSGNKEDAKRYWNERGMTEPEQTKVKVNK